MSNQESKTAIFDTFRVFRFDFWEGYLKAKCMNSPKLKLKAPENVKKGSFRAFDFT